jgi:uncharacterized membrane protein YidH (DUF202 family)
MVFRRLIGIILLVGGILALVYGGFSFTKDEHALKLGPLRLAVQERERVNVPVWAGIGGIVVGAVLLSLKKR